jgi:hypothetical protein
MSNYIQTVIHVNPLHVDSIQGNCPFANPFMPYGFDFYMHGMKAAQDDDEKDIVYTPLKKGYVHVLCSDEEGDAVMAVFPGEKGIRLDSDGLLVKYTVCEKVLGVSMWKLTDLLWGQRGDAIYSEFMACILARKYEVKKYEWKI